jgi:hypothetical protein
MQGAERGTENSLGTDGYPRLSWLLLGMLS